MAWRANGFGVEVGYGMRPLLVHMGQEQARLFEEFGNFVGEARQGVGVGCVVLLLLQLLHAYGKIEECHGGVLLVALVGIGLLVAAQFLVDKFGCLAEHLLLLAQHGDGVKLLAYEQMDDQFILCVFHCVEIVCNQLRRVMGLRSHITR